MIPALSGIREVPVFSGFHVSSIAQVLIHVQTTPDSKSKMENEPGPGGKVSSVWPYELKWTVHLSGRVLNPKGP
jgi:hypothetical protein